MIITRNPWIGENSFRNFVPGKPGPKMTMDGAITKTVFLLACLFVGGWLAFLFPHAGLTARAFQPTQPSMLYHELGVPFFWPGLLAIGLSIVYFIAWHFDELHKYLAPVFALVEGMCLCSWALTSNAYYPGLGLMALAAVVCFLALVVVAYWLGLINPTSPSTLGLVAAGITTAAGIVAILVLRAHGANIALTGVSWVLMVGIVVYMARDLALSFRYIEDAVEMEAPQWMEWKAAFGLMVSLIWIFIMLFGVVRWVLRTMRESRQ